MSYRESNIPAETVIRVDGVSKKYVLGQTGLRTDGLRHVLHGLATAPFRLLKRKDPSVSQPGLANGRANARDTRTSGTFHALRDVTFEVERGQVVGIIGPNGAGKSTLLKILSRITEPTTGRIGLKGRVASLLEVGTGFHPELTGRENIYLNGSILGMSRAEIAGKFDEIIAFAEVEQFLDTPVKRYSTGMYVRLAFAVAAHLQPEILIVDEVLAVGDAAFQKKCLGKMGAVAKEGRTVLFVSHNMAAVLSLCDRAILLQSGALAYQGRTQDVIQQYLHSTTTAAQTPLDQRQDRTGDGSARIVLLEVESLDSDKIIRSTSRLKISVHYRSETPLRHPKFLVGIYDYVKDVGISLLDSEAAGRLPEVLPPEGKVTCVTDPLNVTAGRCFVNLALFKGGAMADYVQRASTFDIEEVDFYGSGKQPSRDWVVCLLKHEWCVNGS
jgi:lipopolysaccharide transport system ATP-binding protein